MELIENMCARIMGITGPWFESALWISLAIVALFEAIHYWKYVRWKRIRGGANYRTFVRVVSWVHLLVGVLLTFILTYPGFSYRMKWLIVSVVSVFVIVFSAWRYRNIYLLEDGRKRNFTNHIFQLSLLFSIGIVVISVCVMLNGRKGDLLVFGAVAALMAWIFEDTVRSVVVYFQLWMTHQLHIGDWIQVPGKNIDGIVESISLTMVTVNNFDNTNSSIPLRILVAGSFINNQRMLDGYTSGRRMLRSFIIDNTSIDICSEAQKQSLIERLKQNGEDTLPLNRETSGETLNLHLFRVYLSAWLYHNEKVAHEPRQLVRFLEITGEGTQLQLYAYIKSTSLMPYENVVAEIVEHVMLSMNWFGLRLYQKPSSADIGKIETAKQIDNGIL